MKNRRCTALVFASLVAGLLVTTHAARPAAALPPGDPTFCIWLNAQTTNCFLIVLAGCECTVTPPPPPPPPG